MSFPEEHPLSVAARCVAEGRAAALATVISADGSTPRQAGAKMVVLPDGRTHGSVGGGRLEHDTIQAAIDAIRTGQPARITPSLSDDLGMCCGGSVEVFVEPLLVATSVVIYGAGHVAKAVVPVLQRLEFRVTVVDDRPELLTEARFPRCALRLTDPEDHASLPPEASDAYVLVMSHDHGRDLRVVQALSGRPLTYLGMLGAHRKRDQLARLLSAHPDADGTVMERIHAPVGLSIGARNPAEIAVAIAAEMIAVRSKARSASHGT